MQDCTTAAQSTAGNRARKVRAVSSRIIVPIMAGALAACGGGTDDPDTGQSVQPVRGQVISSEKTASYTAGSLGAALGLDPARQLILELANSPVCGVDVYSLRYHTVGARNEATTASAALMVPTGLDVACNGPRPVVAYAHGTTVERAFNIADLANNAEGLLMAAIFVAHGYVVVAPNYAGYDSSALGYHPYLVGDQQSKDVIDAVAAARATLPIASIPGTPDVADSGRLLLTGYSQGGHVAMATHRAMQAAGMNVTASAPMSGPYALAAFGDQIFTGAVNLGAPLFFTLLTTAYQQAYGDLYTATTDLYSPAFATGIDTLLPGSIARSTLYAQGRLPQYELFSSTPPEPSLASITPATQPAQLASVYALGFGTNPLVLNSYRLGYLNDAAAQPDGGWPDTTNGLPAVNPAHPLRRAFKANDLRNWTPTTPVLLCGGAEDPTVFYTNTQLLYGYWAANGVSTATVLDVDATGTPGYSELQERFAEIKDLTRAAAVLQGAVDGGDRAVADAYHDQLLPPFCLAAVRSFFSSF